MISNLMFDRLSFFFLSFFSLQHRGWIGSFPPIVEYSLHPFIVHHTHTYTHYGERLSPPSFLFAKNGCFSKDYSDSLLHM